MKFIPAAILLQNAQERKYAVGAFNVFNMESIQAVVQVAEEEQAPVILMCEQRDIGFAGINYLFHIALAAVGEVTVPVALHIDHGTDFNLIKQGVDLGFSSVMIDGSYLPFAENIAITRKVVEVARASGISVEAELGHVGGAGAEATGDACVLTDPDLAADFVAETGVDSLAVAIGTAHGVYVSEPKLDFDRLEQIRRRVDVPLVLHGGSGTPNESLRTAIGMGICKINVGTDIRRKFVSTLVDSGGSGKDVRDVLRPGREAMKEVIRERIRVFGAAGQVRHF